MVEQTDVNITTTTEPSVFEQIIDFIGSAQTLWGVFIAIVCILFFIYCVISFRTKIKKQSNGMINKFINEKKYLPDIYVELNNNMEMLRYYIFSSRWKHRIINQYNSMFKGAIGKMFKNHFADNLNTHISRFTSIQNLKLEISKTLTFIDKLNKEKKEYRESLGDLFFIFRNFTFQYEMFLKKLEQYCDIVDSKNLLLIGSAGNGKTSLLCRTTEMATSNKIPCLLINSRDIQGSCVEYLMDKLPLSFLGIKYRKVYLYVVNVLMKIQRKNFYILIDAVNENDNTEFMNSISDLCNYINKFSRIKLIFSCRSEYFSYRYESLFKQCDTPPLLVNLMKESYDKRATQKLLRYYSDNYNVHGMFSVNLTNNLMNSLLLMRIFFEVNENQSLNNLEFRNAEIHKKYIDKVANENPDIDFKNIIERISANMIENNNFDSVNIQELCLPVSEKDVFIRLLDNNLIINRTIKSGKGITESEAEHIYFVFDEFRDYCLARNLLRTDESAKDIHYTSLFDKIDYLFENKLSPVEGVIKYAYFHFKEMDCVDCCQKLLEVYGKQNISYISNKDYYRNRQSDHFDDFGISLLFMDNESLLPFEYNYLVDTINSSDRALGDIFWFLLRNEYTHTSPRFDLFITLISNEVNYSKLSQFLYSIMRDRDAYYNKTESGLDVCKKEIGTIYEMHGNISDSLKKFIVICMAYKSFSFYADDYQKYGITPEFVNGFISEIQNEELKSSIQKYYNDYTPLPLNQNASDFLRNLQEVIDKYGN